MSDLADLPNLGPVAAGRLMAIEGALTGVDWRRLDPERLAALKQEAKR